MSECEDDYIDELEERIAALEKALGPTGRLLAETCMKRQEENKAQQGRISALEKELLAEQVLHNSAKKLNFTLSEIIREQDTVIAALKGRNPDGSLIPAKPFSQP